MSAVGETASIGGRPRSFDEAVAFHLHNAIQRDLIELFSGFHSNLSRHSTLSSFSSLNSLLPEKQMPLGEQIICQVQFKYVHRHYKLPMSLNLYIQVGKFVIVESFLGKEQEDLGVVTFIYNEEEFEIRKLVEVPSEDAEENTVGQILRLASSEERKLLPVKYRREIPLLHLSQTFVKDRALPMTVYGVTFQFDGSVLFVYYLSQYRVDFRPLVKYLTKYCKGTRIQMKKTNQCRMFVPNPAAAEALVTGKHCSI